MHAGGSFSAPKVSERYRLSNKGLQDTYAAAATCFGCGPANEKGLQLKSFLSGNEVVAEWRAQPHHQAYMGALNGGIIGCLLDCHCNWRACTHLMERDALGTPPCTVTAGYEVTFLRPAPSDETIHLRAEVVNSKGKRVVVAGELMVNDKVCATCEGTFVAVEPGHPAYHRW